MAELWHYTRFEDYNGTFNESLPEYNPEDDFGTDQSLMAMVPIPGRPAYDILGDAQAVGEGREIWIRRLIYDANKIQAQQLVDDWRRHRGKLGRLHAEFPDGGERFKAARLDLINMRRMPGMAFHQVLELRFVLQSSGWFGRVESDEFTLDEGSGVVNVLVLNDEPGTAINRSVEMFLTAASSVSKVVISHTASYHKTQIEWSGYTEMRTQAVAADTVIDVDDTDGMTAGDTCYIVLDNGAIHSTTIASVTSASTFHSGTAIPGGRTADVNDAVTWDVISATKELVIHAGLNTCKRNTTEDAWDQFSFDSTNHQVADWIQLLPGANTLQVTLTGGGTTSIFEVRRRALYE